MTSKKEIKEKYEKLKEDVLRLGARIFGKSKKEAENSIIQVAYLLHRLHKKLMDQDTSESIREMSNRIWWFVRQDQEEKRKNISVNKLYTNWAKEYDRTINLPVFLEEKTSWSFIGDVKNKEVLDYGCGTGRYAIPLAKKGARVTGIDFTEAMLRVAIRKAKKDGVEIKTIKQDITQYKPDKQFDIIISMLVLDHIEKLEKAIEVINKASRVGTRVIISNIHPNLIREDLNEEGKGRGYLLEGIKTDQYYHPLSEYIELFKRKGFYMTKVQDVIYEKKYQNIKRFKKFAGIKNKAVELIMEFEKRE